MDCLFLFIIIILSLELLDLTDTFCSFFFLVQDNQELFVSLMMAYIFNSMTHLAIDVRLMAFKFLELVIQYYPPSFFLYAEKVSKTLL